MKLLGKLTRILVGGKHDPALERNGELIKANTNLRGEVAKLRLRNDALEMLIEDLDDQSSMPQKSDAYWTSVLR